MMLWYNFVSFLGILQVPSPLCYPGNITCLVEKCKEKGAMSLRTELGGKINFCDCAKSSSPVRLKFKDSNGNIRKIISDFYSVSSSCSVVSSSGTIGPDSKCIHSYSNTQSPEFSYFDIGETGEKCSTCSCKATGCTGIPGDTRGHDACGVCAGLNSTCADCAGVPWGTFTLDRCGICNGGDKSCIDKSGKVCALPLKLDQCGICGGDGTTCSDCRGVIGGSAQYDACGVCEGNNASCTDCCGIVHGKCKRDFCGICDSEPDNDNTECCVFGSYFKQIVPSHTTLRSDAKAACDLTHQCTSTIVGIKAKDLSFALEKDLKLRNSLDIYDSILAYSYTNNVHYNITQNVISLQSGLRGCVEMLCEFCNDKHYKAVRHSTLCGYRPPIGTIEIAPFKTLNDMCGALTYKNPTLVPTKSPTNTLQPSARPTLVNISTPLYKTGYSDSRKSTFGVIAGIRLKGSSNTMVLIQSWYRNNNTVAIKLVNAFEHSLKNCLYTHADRNPRVNAYEVSLHNEELIFRYRIDVNAIETSSLCPLCTSMSLTQSTGNCVLSRMNSFLHTSVSSSVSVDTYTYIEIATIEPTSSVSSSSKNGNDNSSSTLVIVIAILLSFISLALLYTIYIFWKKQTIVDEIQTQEKDDTGNLISKKKLKTNEIVQGEALLNSKDEESSHNFKGTQYLGKNGSDGSKRVAITIVGAFGNDKNFDRHFKASKKLTENPPKNKIYHIKVLQRGIDLMEKFDHDNILALIGVAHGVSSQIIVTPLCEGSLERLLKLGIVDFQIKPRIGQDCAVAMEYLSGKGFVFWDLAARNILLDENFKSKLFHLEVCDFGMRSPSAHSYLSAFGSKKIKWPAPEVLNLDTKYTSMSDVWHYGLLLYEIWTDASIPYGSDWIDERAMLSTLNSLHAGDLLPQPQTCPDNIYNVMCNCWHVEPSLRPNFSGILVKLRSKNVFSNDELYASLSRSSQHVDLGNIGNNRVNPDYWNDEEVRSMAEHYFQVTSTFSEREVRTPHEEVVQVMNRLSERHVFPKHSR